MKQRGEKRITALFSERGRSFQANRARFSFTTYNHSGAHLVPIAILPSPGEREREREREREEGKTTRTFLLQPREAVRAKDTKKWGHILFPAQIHNCAHSIAV